MKKLATSSIRRKAQSSSIQLNSLVSGTLCRGVKKLAYLLDAGPSAAPPKRRKQPAEAAGVVHAVEAELDDDDVSYDDDDDDAGDDPPPPAPPVLCYCERPAALLDGRWVCAQLVEGDFCILGREDE